MLLWFILAVICGTIPSIVPIDCPTEYEQAKKDILALQNEVAVLKDKAEKVSAFSARLTGDLVVKDDPSVPFKYVMTNVGNDYDPNTGVFTCRIPGLYFFSGHAITAPSKSAWFTLVRKRGETEIFIARPYTNSGTGHHSGADLGTVQLKKGDKVYAYNKVPTLSITLDKMSTFAGALIKAD